MAELDAMRARGAEALRSARVEAAGGTAPSGVDNSVEKASEMLQRAAIGLKQLSQTLVAPGRAIESRSGHGSTVGRRGGAGARSEARRGRRRSSLFGGRRP